MASKPKENQKLQMLEKCRQIAQTWGGECLSRKYVNSKAPLIWKCDKGHTWMAAYNDIRSKDQGSGQKRIGWCPKCAATERGKKRRLSIDEMIVRAAELGGKCLSETYTTAHTHLLWECEHGHQFKATPANVNNGHWCPTCSHKKVADMQRASLDDMHKLAKTFEGKCLSKEYHRTGDHLLWECAKGHKFEASPRNIKSGTWCPECAGNKKSTIDKMHKIAEAKGGKCLASVYKDARSKLLWECAKGHRFKASAGNVKAGHWCPECSGCRKGTIEEMQQIAAAKGGKCLSEAYLGAKKKLLWQCSNGNQWEATPEMVKNRNSWCKAPCCK